MKNRLTLLCAHLGNLVLLSCVGIPGFLFTFGMSEGNQVKCYQFYFGIIGLYVILAIFSFFFRNYKKATKIALIPIMLMSILDGIDWKDTNEGKEYFT